MKKILISTVIIFVIVISLSMFAKVTDIKSEKKGMLEMSQEGYDDIPLKNGL